MEREHLNELESPLDEESSDSENPADDSSETVDLERMYLNEAGKYPLLPNEKVLGLIEQFQKGRKAKKRLENQDLGKGKRQELAKLVKKGYKARTTVVQHNLRLVVSIARKTSGLTFLDRIQEGNFGLYKAIDKFDLGRKTRFSTYTTYWIRQTIQRAVDNHGRVDRLPPHILNDIRLINGAWHVLKQSLKREPSDKEMAKWLEKRAKERGSKTKWTAEKVEGRMRLSRPAFSLEFPVGDDEDSEFGEFLEDENSLDPEEEAHRSLLEDSVIEVLEDLEPREREILELRYGLTRLPPMTLEEVGDKFDVTRERIRQIERKALRRLRHPLNASKFRD